MTKAKLVSAALSATTAFLSVAPIALASTVEVSGNGADSQNTANLSISQTVTLQQQNNADVDNNVDASANTGGNEASDNTGGDVSINTGDASTSLSLSTTANSNKLSGVCCDDLSVDAKISGNGADSDNEINLSLNRENSFIENNNLDVDNRVELYANTGDNRANGNTGGDVSINTGNALIELVLTNKGNSNVVNCDCDEQEPEEELPPLPGTVKAIPAAAAPVGQTLPMTGFDYNILFAGSALVSGAGVLLRKNSNKIEKFLGKLV